MLFIFSKGKVATFLLVVLKSIRLVLRQLKDNLLSFSHSLTLFSSMLNINSTFPFCSHMENEYIHTYIHTYICHLTQGDLGLLAGVGSVSVSRSHMSFYLRTGEGGRHMCRSSYISVNISRLLIFQSLH